MGAVPSQGPVRFPGTAPMSPSDIPFTLWRPRSPFGPLGSREKMDGVSIRHTVGTKAQFLICNYGIGPRNHLSSSLTTHYSSLDNLPYPIPPAIL